MQFLVLYLKGMRWSLGPPHKALSIFKTHCVNKKDFEYEHEEDLIVD